MGTRGSSNRIGGINIDYPDQKIIAKFMPFNIIVGEQLWLGQK